MALRSSPNQLEESLRSTEDTELRGSGNYDFECFGDPVKENENSSNVYLIGNNLVLNWEEGKAF